jgi:hypothetical protein
LLLLASVIGWLSCERVKNGAITVLDTYDWGGPVNCYLSEDKAERTQVAIFFEVECPRIERNGKKVSLFPRWSKEALVIQIRPGFSYWVAADLKVWELGRMEDILNQSDVTLMRLPDKRQSQRLRLAQSALSNGKDGKHFDLARYCQTRQAPDGGANQ